MSRDNQPAGKSQPSLLPQSASNNSEQSRILANLEDGGTAASKRPPSGASIKRFGVAALLLAIIAGSGWFLFPDKPSTPDATTSSAGAAGNRVKDVVNPAVAVPAATPPVTEVAPMVATAQIVDDPSVLGHADSSVTKKSNMQEILSAKPEANAISKALEITPSDKIAVTHASGVGEKTSASSKAKIPAKALPESKKQAAESPPKNHAKTQGDSDIALLTAIVAHNHENPPSDTGPAKKPGKIASLIKNDDDSNAQVSVAEASNLPVKEQLLRCKKLGAQEADLCKWRVCSGSKSGDPACK